MYWHPRLWRNWDWWLTLFVLLTLGLGLAVVSSAAHGFNPDFAKGALPKQIAGIALGLGSWVLCGVLDYNEFRNLSRFIYWGNILMLVAVLVVGVEQNGSQRWIDLGPIQIQPAELSKLFLTLTLAKVLVETERLESWWDLCMPLLHAAPTIVLVLLQRDLGTTIVLCTITVALIYVAGFPARKLLLVGGLVAAIVVGIVYSHYNYGTSFPFKDYQWDRINVFLYPESDPLDTGYQVMQSKVAIGTGGLFGKGLYEGTQNQLGFLPYQHTDFIYAVVVEELGFVGGATVIFLFALIFFRFAMVASAAKDTYGSLICIGVATLYLVHVLENIGMTMGVAPVTGLTLPLISYGPTALVTNLVGIGLIQSVAVHRDIMSFQS